MYINDIHKLVLYQTPLKASVINVDQWHQISDQDSYKHLYIVCISGYHRTEDRGNGNPAVGNAWWWSCHLKSTGKCHASWTMKHLYAFAKTSFHYQFILMKKQQDTVKFNKREPWSVSWCHDNGNGFWQHDLYKRSFKKKGKMMIRHPTFQSH